MELFRMVIQCILNIKIILLTHFHTGDTYFKITVKTKFGYLVCNQEKVSIVVVKGIPTYTVPDNLTANLFQKLSEIELPDGFEWMDGNQIIMESGNVKYKAKFIPSDIEKYEIVENIDIILKIEETREIITPNITIPDKIYDGTNNIANDDIIITGLNVTDYSIVSAITDNVNVGTTNAKITLRLTAETSISYAFDNGKNEKAFDIEININPAKLVKPTLSEKEYTYNGEEQIIELKNFDEEKMNITGNSRTDAGEQNVLISLKNANYVWEDGKNDDIVYIFKINKANLNIMYSGSDKIYQYNEELHGIELTINDLLGVTIKYADENDEYILDEMPQYSEIGTYIIKYKIYKDENYTEIFGQNTVTIVENYVIGDINGDGKVNIKDWNILYNHINETGILIGNQFLYADVNGDGKVNIKDWNRMYDHITEVNPLW